MSALELVNTLQAKGVRFSLEGGRIRYEPRSSVQGEDLEQLKSYRAEVVELLERPVQVRSTWAEPTTDTPETRPTLERLPNALERMVRAASNDALPTGTAKLSSGLVMDLNAYVTRWACAYLTGDTQEASRRLLEAYTALHGGKA